MWFLYSSFNLFKWYYGKVRMNIQKNMYCHIDILFILLRISEHTVMETPTQTHAKFISTEICHYGAVTSVNQQQKCLQLTARTEQMFRTHRGTAHSGITWREGIRYQTRQSYACDLIFEKLTYFYHYWLISARVPHTLLLLLSSSYNNHWGKLLITWQLP